MTEDATTPGEVDVDGNEWIFFRRVALPASHVSCKREEASAEERTPNLAGLLEP